MKTMEKAKDGLKLIIFGATGPTGRQLVKQALDQGHYVTAVARTPEKITTEHEKLEVVKGDACDLESFADVVKGKDAVMSCLGAHVSFLGSTTLYSESVKAITEAMKRHKVTRLVCMTSWCVQPGPNNPWIIEWIFKPLMIRELCKDATIMEQFLDKTDTQEVNFTIVRPSGLTNEPANGNYKIEEGQCNVGTKYRIPRADVAAFMLGALDTDEYDRKGMAISSL